MNLLGDSGVHTLGDTSAFVNSAGQLLLTRRGKTRMDGVDIVFEFYIAPLKVIVQFTTMNILLCLLSDIIWAQQD